MQCPDKTTLSAYAAEELTPREWSLVDKHFAQCETCQEEIAGWRAVHEVLDHTLGMKPESDALVQRIIDRLNKQERD